MITKTFILPAYWASYLINNDASGISTEDKHLADKFLTENSFPSPVSCSDESYFSWDNDADTGVGGDVLEYTFLLHDFSLARA